MSDIKPLQKITTILLDGQDYDLAKNGEYSLVESRGEDAYGNPISERVQLVEWIRGDRNIERVQALLDALGDATVRLQAQRDARLAGRPTREPGDDPIVSR